MKTSVDLTEEQLFSSLSSFHLEDMEVRHQVDLSKIKHKAVPWERTEPGEPAEEISLLNDYYNKKINYLLSETRNLTLIESDDDLIMTSPHSLEDDEIITEINANNADCILSDISDGIITNTLTTNSGFINLSSSTNISISRTSTNTSQRQTSYSALYYDNENYYNIINTTMNMRMKSQHPKSIYEEFLSLVPSNEDIFPLGKRDVIKEKRKPYVPYDTERDIISFLRTLPKTCHKCKLCGKNISRKELGERLISANVCCDCTREIDEENKHPKRKICVEYLYNRFIMSEEDEKVIEVDGEMSSLSLKRDMTEDKMDPRNVHWLHGMKRFEEEDEVSSYQGVPYDKYFFVMRIPDEEEILTHPISHYCVYYRHRELRIREEPWQPKGRVPQWYDKIFDSMNWKDLFQERVESLTLT